MPPEEANRARAWARSCQEAVCDSIEEWEHGWIVRTPSYPRYFDLSLVHIASDPGFDAAGVMSFRLALPESGYPDSATTKMAAFLDELESRRAEARAKQRR